MAENDLFYNTTDPAQMRRCVGIYNEAAGDPAKSLNLKNGGPSGMLSPHTAMAVEPIEINPDLFKGSAPSSGPEQV